VYHLLGAADFFRLITIKKHCFDSGLIILSLFCLHCEYRVTVPTNVNFLIRRYGEWIMLMLGESVLSLLIVDIVESSDYYITIITGLISIILLQYLHYQSQPSDPNLHAYRRSLVSSFLFYYLMQIYSFALIVFGATYKMLLYEFIYREKYDKNYSGSTRVRGLIFHVLNHHPRFLVGDSDSNTLSSQLSPEEREQRDAHFFSGSLSVIFFCLDALSLAHRGIGTQWKRCECADTNLKKFLAWVLVLCRLLLLIFVASLSQYITDPTQIAVIGVTVVVTQLCIRFVGYYVFHSEKEAEDKALERIIQYNTARIHERSPSHHIALKATHH
jgi:small-conductance mechanosensitive channel